MRRHEDRILSLEGVTGMGVETREGREVIVAYVRSRDVEEHLPTSLDGIPLRCTVTGDIKAQRDRS